MGNWQLEVGKMAIYMLFPVASFYAYHQVDWFAEDYKEMQKKIYTPEVMKNKEEMQEFLAEMRKRHEKKRQQELMKYEKSTTEESSESKS